MPRASNFTADAVVEARRRYDAGDSLTSIATFLGVVPGTLRKYARSWCWPERLSNVPAHASQEQPATQTDPSPAGAPAAAAAQGTGEAAASSDDASAPADTRTLSRRLEKTVRRELASIEQRLAGAADPAEAERNARIIASLVKSLAELAKLDEARAGTARKSGTEGRGVDAGQSDQRPPRNMAELRAELAARLERIRSSRPAATGD